MIRFIASFIMMWLLFAAELYVVARINGYTTLQINNYIAVVPILATNFFLAFSFIAQLTPWLEKKNIIVSDTEEQK